MDSLTRYNAEWTDLKLGLECKGGMVLAITGSLPGRPWALLIIMETDPLNQEHDRPHMYC